LGVGRHEVSQIADVVTECCMPLTEKLSDISSATTEDLLPRAFPLKDDIRTPVLSNVAFIVD